MLLRTMYPASFQVAFTRDVAKTGLVQTAEVGVDVGDGWGLCAFTTAGSRALDAVGTAAHDDSRETAVNTSAAPAPAAVRRLCGAVLSSS